ncbi:D-amino acid dehydrogenase 1 [Methylobacterium adhaesivum]|uniref:D-amino acid dehydrogenase n=1 Tax=Methylobacterium adhaesivum TaxID=333297 RepID=A0ABT8BMW3_9HYPH|nr:D-amino acid dehydrogenase [Methylobacterium adhaesivum]MDN3592880.1 D-amino acid dehydrogenase [Methylobacterium adhaesivum]GJD29519.1 D-amino acid dehydrogenase 1 [Methylobacterium adhaesivum]
MHVLILGGGVVGVTTAYYLAKAGHRVTLVERQPGVGLETSFANAGQVSPGYSAPWAAPGIPLKALKWMMMRHRPLVLWPRFEPQLYGWLARMLANCTEEAYARNKGRMVRLAEYSRDSLRDLRRDTGIAYDHREKGTLQLFRTRKQLDHVDDDTRVLDKFGVPYAVLDPAGCIAAEPALARVPNVFVGGLRLPGDETGDAHLFTQRLAALCSEAGVVFQHGASIARLRQGGGTVTGVELVSGEVLVADAYVAAMGSYTPALLRPLGIDLPVYPVKGYSLTLPVIDPGAAPVSTVMDETYKVAITRLGDRIRVGGTAELAGFSQVLRQPRRETLARSIGDLFPAGGDPAGAKFWTGLRPMTPDGTPFVGATRLSNLYTNTGHGTLGWTMACGSGRLLSDLISGRKPDIPSADLACDRGLY